MIIAVDGPAAAGKGTLARALAKEFNFAYLDSGALYRAVALSLIKQGISADNVAAAANAATAINDALLTDPALRTEQTAAVASSIAKYPEVRNNLLNYQRNFSLNPPENKAGAVLDGRDIGTVICPQADLKFFITASPEVRAERRYKEAKAAGKNISFDQILYDVTRRDAQDRSRKVAPLIPADDAVLLDTSNLDIDAVFYRAAALVKAAL